jgi:hypothetical protein
MLYIERWIAQSYPGKFNEDQDHRRLKAATEMKMMSPAMMSPTMITRTSESPREIRIPVSRNITSPITT